MRISTFKLSVVGSLVAAIAMTGAASASADTTTCSNTGTIKLSPGLSNTAQVQNVTIKGKLTGSASFFWGHQGYEYVDLGRIWQILLFVGLLKAELTKVLSMPLMFHCQSQKIRSNLLKLKNIFCSA